MNILLISTLYPVKEGHYKTEVVTHALHNFVKEWLHSNNVMVIRPVFKNMTPIPFYYYPRKNISPGRYQLDNVDVFAVPIYRIPIIEIFFTHKVESFLSAQQFNPDVIIAHSGANIPLGSIISKKLKTPLISGIHFSDMLNLEKNNHTQRCFIKAVHHSDGIACRSPHILNWLRTRQLFPADKIFPAYSGIDESVIDFSALKRKEGLPWKKDQPLVISCTASSLIKSKHTDTIIKALSSLEKNWILHVIGDGEEREHLTSLTKSLKLEKKVIFHGYLSHRETFRMLSLSHVFAKPSYPETFGIVYLEAMAKGNIVIGGANTGIDGLIENGVHGFLVSPGNVDELKTLFENICFHFDPTYLKQILQRSFSLCQKMTSQHMAEEYIRNISEVINF